MTAFPLAQGKSGPEVQSQLPRVERLQHIAERIGRWSRRNRGSPGAVRQADHGNVELAPDPFGRFEAVHIRSKVEIDQGRIGSRFRRLFNGFGRGRGRRAHVVPQTLQALLQTPGVGTVAPDHQNPCIRHRVLVPSHAFHACQWCPVTCESPARIHNFYKYTKFYIYEDPFHSLTGRFVRFVRVFAEQDTNRRDREAGLPPAEERHDARVVVRPDPDPVGGPERDPARIEIQRPERAFVAGQDHDTG